LDATEAGSPLEAAGAHRQIGYSGRSSDPGNNLRNPKHCLLRANKTRASNSDRRHLGFEPWGVRDPAAADGRRKLLGMALRTAFW